MQQYTRTVSYMLLFVSVLVLGGCYHARIITGQPESDVVYEKKWVTGFVNGLVIPDDLEVSEKCPHGVARVETRLSFMNLLVTWLTGGIYSPMEVRVTCAAPAGSARVLQDSDAAKLVGQAAQMSIETGQPVYIQPLRDR